MEERGERQYMSVAVLGSNSFVPIVGARGRARLEKTMTALHVRVATNKQEG